MHIEPYKFGLDFFGLIIFGLGSFVIISVLLFYYRKIPKRNDFKSEFDTPIYLSKDSLLQTTNFVEGFILVEKKKSTFTKFRVYVLIAIVVFTPLY